MVNYYLFDHRDGLCHPFPFTSYARAERHNRTLGGCYEVRGYRVQVISENETEERELNTALEADMEREARMYAEEKTRYGY